MEPKTATSVSLELEVDKARISSHTGCLCMGKRVIASYCSSFLKVEMLHIYRQIKALRGVDTFVVTKELQNAEHFPFPHIEVIPKRRTNLLVHGWLKFVERRPPIVYRGEYQTLDSLLKRHGADLMHIYFGHTGVHLLPFIEQWDKPCVVSFHGADVADKPEIKDYHGKLARLFHAVPLVLARSQSLADRLIQFGCPPEKLRINRTGVPLDEFLFVARQPPSDGQWKIVQACRLIPKKGVATSLRAFAIFKKDHPKAEFFLAGKGPLQPELEMLAAGLGIFKDVHFVGFLSQVELLKLYTSSHLLLHPSETLPNQDQEGVPNSVLEAMATGLPVVATRHGGIPEAVEDSRNGFLADEEDHLGLANAMEQITRSPGLLKEMGLRARDMIVERFAQKAQIDQLESFYEEAIRMNAAAEPETSRRVAQLGSPFAERVPAE
jgi:colanic acid/amylovoran biosynthesis glycosyltransferase